MRGKRMKFAAFAAAAISVACAAASSAPAAPIIPAAAAVKELASTQETAVNYRRRYCGRGYHVRHYYKRRYAHSHWIYRYPPTGCENTFPASCSYPYPYFGFVYGWRGIW